MPGPGNSPDRPLYMRMVTDDDGSIRWGRIVLMLALTAASGYLASRSQRWGSSAARIPVKARAYHAAGAFAHAQVVAWQRLEAFAKTGYEIATMD